MNAQEEIPWRGSKCVWNWRDGRSVCDHPPLRKNVPDRTGKCLIVLARICKVGIDIIVKEKMPLVEAVESTDKVARDNSVSGG